VLERDKYANSNAMNYCFQFLTFWNDFFRMNVRFAAHEGGFVNQALSDKDKLTEMTPLMHACQLKHRHIAEILIRPPIDGIKVCGSDGIPWVLKRCDK
jgi:hypothetical protein